MKLLQTLMKQPKKKSEDLSDFEVVAEFVKPEEKEEVIGSESREEAAEDDFSDLDTTLEDGLDSFNDWDDDGGLDQVYGFSPEQSEILKDLKDASISEEVIEEPLEEIQEERIVGLVEQNPQTRKIRIAGEYGVTAKADKSNKKNY